MARDVPSALAMTRTASSGVSATARTGAVASSSPIDGLQELEVQVDRDRLRTESLGLELGRLRFRRTLVEVAQQGVRRLHGGEQPAPGLHEHGALLLRRRSGDAKDSRRVHYVSQNHV